MKRIVLIGNGFDLATGAATSYSDFYAWWMNTAFEKIKKGEEKVDETLFEIRLNPDRKCTQEELSEIDILENSNVKRFRKFNFLGETNNTNNQIPSSKHVLNLVIKDKLFSEISSKKGWADIEKFYFDLLIDVFKKPNYHKKSIQSLNNSLELIRMKLIEYLKTINYSDLHVPKLRESINTILTFEGLYSGYDYDYENSITRRFENKKVEKIVCINFNYTDFLFKTLEQIHQLNENLDSKLFKTISNNGGVMHIPIHGSLSNENQTKENQIIFGYGDEKHKLYREIEELDNDDFLKNFKSNRYAGASNYNRVMDEVDDTEFDVAVIGHSLGLSDRILLNTIFEHKNCKAIHLFHRGGDSHFRKRIALSRHFDDKVQLRQKLMMESSHLELLF